MSIRQPQHRSSSETTRQWSLLGFEWAIKGVSRLCNFVEGTSASVSNNEGVSQLTVDDFELLKQSPLLGDKFKIEIALTSPSVEGDGRPLLSLYVISLLPEYPSMSHREDFATCATMMAAIKCQEDKTGERGARPEWIWEFWQHDWVFRPESEVWECPLPALSELLKNPRVRETDSFVICIQIHSPSGPSIPHQPSVSYVPRDLLNGLEASLDNPNTGDVRFVCLERFVENSETLSASGSLSRYPSSSSSPIHHPFSTHTTARKRVIYAHSDILIGRSEYFATMLSSSFSENTHITPGERKMHTIVVEEADFDTIYWLLKFCYANWLLFKQTDDPRAAVEGVGAGWSAKWLNSRENEWDWKTFYKSSGEEGGFDSRSATSGDSTHAGASVVSRANSKKSDPPDDTPIATSTLTTPSVRPGIKPSPAVRSPAVTPKRPQASTSTTVVSGSNATGTRVKPIPAPAVATTSFPSSRAFPHQARAPRQVSPSSPDPHPHPTPAPPPASALAMYQVAHRYAMSGLANLALEHMMSTITPQTCFPLLLASYTWDELYTLVEDYVIDKWDEVSSSAEFESCCKEIAAGEWGADGGQTLMSVFRRLRSPSNLPA